MLLGGQLLYVDLIVLGFKGFYYIIGLEWMSKHRVTINMASRTMSFEVPR